MVLRSAPISSESALHSAWQFLHNSQRDVKSSITTASAARKLCSFLGAAFLSASFPRFLPRQGVALIWNFEHFSTLLLTLAISGAVLGPCDSGHLVAPLSGRFYFPLTFHPRIRRAFVGCWSCLPRLELCTSRSSGESWRDVSLESSQETSMWRRLVKMHCLLFCIPAAFTRCTFAEFKTTRFA